MVESIRVLYDNRSKDGFVADWGFSAFIEADCGNILFDTGADATVLSRNMELFGISPNDVDAVFISHNHWDHTGGLKYIVSAKSDIEVFVPESDCEEFEEELPESSICVPISEPTYISECAVSTGVMNTGLEKPSHEQSLVLKTQEGSVLVVGCSHPGIVNIVRFAYELAGEKLFLVIGGFHLYKKSRSEVIQIAESLKEFVENVAPCHCTGEEAIGLFKEVWKDKFIEVVAGSELEFGGVDV